MYKAKKALSILLSAAMLFAVSCSPTNTSVDEPPDSYVSEYSIQQSKLFSIRYLADGVKIVTDSAGRELALVPDGVDAPVEADAMTIVRTPIKSAVYLSTTFVGLMGALGEESVYDTVVGVATDKDDWTTPQIVKRFDEGTVKYLLDSNYATDVESIIALKPDVVFIVGGQADGMETSLKLDDVAVANMQVSEYLESGALAYLEWVKFFGAFFNMDAKADLVFRQRSARLDELRNMASKIDDAARPVVAYGNIYNGTIYTPSSDSTVAQEVAAAGGKYYLDNLPGEGSVQLSMEEFLSKAKDADIMIYTSMILYTPDRQALVEADPLFAELNAYKDDRVYVLAKSYYMQAAQTDVKFQEMVALIQPELGLEANGVFFEKLK